MNIKKLSIVLSALLLGQSALASAQGDNGGNQDHQIIHPQHDMDRHKPMGSVDGQPGQADEVSRTITVNANDQMRFQFSDQGPIKAGDTIRFVVTNTGQLAHEFVLARAAEHQTHGQMMAQVGQTMDRSMQHHSMPNALSLAPGEQKTLIWRFEQSGPLEAACNLPGHYQAGMVQPLDIQ